MHMHTTTNTTIRPYLGAVVAWSQNPSAHGGHTVREHCACGAHRDTNANGVHEERGPWVPPRINRTPAPGVTLLDADHAGVELEGANVGRMRMTWHELHLCAEQEHEETARWYRQISNAGLALHQAKRHFAFAELRGNRR